MDKDKEQRDKANVEIRFGDSVNLRITTKDIFNLMDGQEDY